MARPRVLSQSEEAYLKADGWSSFLFLPSMRALVPWLQEQGWVLEFGRTVVYLRKHDTFVKAYVHHNGRSKEYLTLTDEHGAELSTFHHTSPLQSYKDFFTER